MFYALQNSYIEGIEKIFVPYVRPGTEKNADDFIKAIRKSIETVETEEKLESTLVGMDLLFPVSQCEIVERKEPKRKAKKRKVNKRTEETFMADGRRAKRKRNNVNVDSEASNESDGTEGEIEFEKDDSVNSEASRTEKHGSEEDEIEIEKGLLRNNCRLFCDCHTRLKINDLHLTSLKFRLNSKCFDLVP